MDLAKFTLFIMKEIFPGGQLPSAWLPRKYAAEAGFTVTRDDEIGPHYARTLEDWAAMLAANKERAIEVQGQEAYDRFDKYLNGCVKLFRDGYNTVHQYTLQSSRGPACRGATAAIFHVNRFTLDPLSCNS